MRLAGLPFDEAFSSMLLQSMRSGGVNFFPAWME